MAVSQELIRARAELDTFTAWLKEFNEWVSQQRAGGVDISDMDIATFAWAAGRDYARKNP